MHVALTFSSKGAADDTVGPQWRRALEALGLEVDELDTCGAPEALCDRLLSMRPALVLDVTGDLTVRSLLEGLGLPFVGSATSAINVTLDRHAAKLATWSEGIETPRWTLVTSAQKVRLPSQDEPLRIFPRRASASGPEQAGAACSTDELESALSAALEAHPGGVLLEADAPGADLVVHLLGNDRLLLPSGIDEQEREKLGELCRRAATALSLRDAASVKLRKAPSGPLFLSAEPLPSLSPTGALSSAAGGLNALAEALVAGACKRLALPWPPKAAPLPRRKLKVGLTYNLKRISPSSGDDSEAEFDVPDTIEAIGAALTSLGHEAHPLEADRRLPTRLARAGLDLVFNIAEGAHGRGREAQVPALLDLLGIEYTGSEPAALSLTLDKALAKHVVRHAGVRTPAFFTLSSAQAPLPAGLRYPVIVKPVAEGSSKGVLGTSVAEDEEQLRALARALIERYHQEALVEEYLPGREFTVALLGERGTRVLPPMEIVFCDESVTRKVYTFEHKQAWTSAIRYDAPAIVDAALRAELEQVATAAFHALGCRDVARMDLRLDAEGRVNFMECNPLPGLSPGWSDLCLIAQGVSMNYEQVIGAILEPAIGRLHMRESRAQGAPTIAETTVGA